MTVHEYIENVPANHLAHQQKVNAELWYQWNLADHKRVVNGNGWDYYSPEKTIFSAAVERTKGLSSALSLCYTVCERRWKQEQECHISARIGEIFFAKDGKGRWDTDGICISYALERVDAPRRWNKYCVHHLPSERFQDVILQHME
jgi:hypothetical protein